MDSLYLLIPIALLFCILAIKLLLWAISSGQYDDLDKEAWRILAEEEPQEISSTTVPAPSAAADEAAVTRDSKRA